jgi:hypothetical protein
MKQRKQRFQTNAWNMMMSDCCRYTSHLISTRWRTFFVAAHRDYGGELLLEKAIAWARDYYNGERSRGQPTAMDLLIPAGTVEHRAATAHFVATTKPTTEPHPP